MTRFLCFTALLLAGGLAGCAISKSGGVSGTAAPIRLTASLISPADIELKWQDPDPRVAGHVVEYASEPNGEYIILDFFLPNETTYTHSNLMPGTKFYYRVRGFYGPASLPVEVRLPGSLSETDYVARFAAAEDYSWAFPKTVGTEVRESKKSIRADLAAATPTGLQVSLVPVTVSGFKLTWTDRAGDEDGYLLETRPEGSQDFQVCGLLASNINSVGYGLTPPARKAAFRVRAFYYGKPSNLASATTLAASAPEATRNAN